MDTEQVRRRAQSFGIWYRVCWWTGAFIFRVFLRNFGGHIFIYMASCRRRWVCSSVPLWEPRILHRFSSCRAYMNCVVVTVLQLGAVNPFPTATPPRGLSPSFRHIKCRKLFKFQRNKLKWVYIQPLQRVCTKIYRKKENCSYKGYCKRCRLQFPLLTQALKSTGLAF
jgi:hypothetical protein